MLEGDCHVAEMLGQDVCSEKWKDSYGSEFGQKSQEDGNKSTGDLSKEEEHQRWKNEDLKPDTFI